MVAVGWWLQLKMRSRSAFDGVLSLIYPLFFATTVLFIYRQGGDTETMISAAVGASVLGVWSAVATTASTSLQQERRQGTLELLVAAPTPFSLLMIPITLAMATIGLYSLVLTLLWSRFVFAIPVSMEHPVAFAVASVVCAMSVASLGFVLSVTVVRYRSAWSVGTALELPVWLICGFLVPIEQLPEWVRPVSWLIPVTWAVDGIRGAALGGRVWPSLALSLAVSACYVVIGAFVARRAVTSARRHASLALT